MDNIENTRNYTVLKFMPVKCHKCGGAIFGLMLLYNSHDWYLRCLNKQCNNVIHIIIENNKVDLCDTIIRINGDGSLN